MPRTAGKKNAFAAKSKGFVAEPPPVCSCRASRWLGGIARARGAHLGAAVSLRCLAPAFFSAARLLLIIESHDALTDRTHAWATAVGLPHTLCDLRGRELALPIGWAAVEVTEGFVFVIHLCDHRFGRKAWLGGLQPRSKTNLARSAASPSASKKN